MAAASLIVDYVLNVAVSVAAGVAALTSACPALLPYTVWLCLGVLAAVTAVNLRGVANSGRSFIVPTVIYVSNAMEIVTVRVKPRPAPPASASTRTIASAPVGDRRHGGQRQGGQ